MQLLVVEALLMIPRQASSSRVPYPTTDCRQYSGARDWQSSSCTGAALGALALLRCVGDAALGAVPEAAGAAACAAGCLVLRLVLRPRLRCHCWRLLGWNLRVPRQT
jgi:hypothetical protein